MNQYGSEPPPGLENERGQRETTLLMTGTSTSDSAIRRDPCSNAECPNYDPAPMEAVWTEFMSPVAYGGQVIHKGPAPGTTQPDESRFEEIILALRPDGIGAHAVETIRKTWSAVVEDRLESMPGRLMSALAELSGFWVGEDFDRFAEEVEQVRDSLYDTIDEIDTAANELKVFEDRVRALQGSGAGVPFPAARVWKASSGVVQGPKIHVRPVWSSGGDCDKSRSEGDNWEALGLPRDSGDELRALVYERFGYYTERGMDGSAAWDQAVSDYSAVQLPLVGHWSTTMSAVAENHNLGIVDLRDQLVDAQEAPSLEAGPRPLPESAADAILEPLPELDPGPLPQMPPLDGLDRFTPPTQQAVPEFPSPRADWSAADYGSTGGYDGGNAADWDRSAMDSSSWNRPASDDLSGGLASGGLPSGGGLASGGFGGATGGSGGFGPPSGAGSQAGGMGGAFGATPGAAGNGRGGATARPANARPGSARPGGAGAPGARGAGSDEGEHDRETWLTEDSDVWGIVAEDDDPYA
ncbi:WXG100 family type VII secretion target [Glycomyces sp. NRRL B-16210]|uniref:WXG100 family type VII secretion target n=1 Tax=Glycomyces sp. NRRL B-16210 TaxID=1463821 RepID=UPI0004C09D76|nr:WXG100 family type VII secretion target [Glycomyces sp. NRRL B-16210]